MKSSDRQLSEILIRSGRIRTAHNILRHILTDIVSSVVCVLLMAAASYSIPRISGRSAAIDPRYGSLVLSTSHMGYVVIGILAFVLGVFVTLLCIHIREYRGSGDGKK